MQPQKEDIKPKTEKQQSDCELDRGSQEKVDRESSVESKKLEPPIENEIKHEHKVIKLLKINQTSIKSIKFLSVQNQEAKEKKQQQFRVISVDSLTQQYQQKRKERQGTS